MSRPKFEDAVLLAAGYLYGSNRTPQSPQQPVLLRDVIRAVARVYGLPSQSSTQMINESRLEEGKSARPDGQALVLAPNDVVMSLEDAVKMRAVRLEAHGHVELRTGIADRQFLSVDDRLFLTPAGAERAQSVAKKQVIVDFGTIDRIQWDDPLKTRLGDHRLERHVSSIGDKFTPAAPMSAAKADERWMLHLTRHREPLSDPILPFQREPSPSEPQVRQTGPAGNAPRPAPTNPQPDGPKGPSGPSIGF